MSGHWSAPWWAPCQTIPCHSRPSQTKLFQTIPDDTKSCHSIQYQLAPVVSSQSDGVLGQLLYIVVDDWVASWTTVKPQLLVSGELMLDQDWLLKLILPTATLALWLSAFTGWPLHSDSVDSKDVVIAASQWWWWHVGLVIALNMARCIHEKVDPKWKRPLSFIWRQSWGQHLCCNSSSNFDLKTFSSKISG